MAIITVGSIGPIVPLVAHDGKSGPILSVPITSSNVVQAGDVMILTTGKAVVDNAPQAVNVVLGVAIEPKATIATAADNDQLLIALAAPGRTFVGHMTGGATTDYATPAYSDLYGAQRVIATPANQTGVEIVEATVTGYAVLVGAASATTGAAWPFGFAREQLGGKRFQSGASGTVNPRVYFTFRPDFLAF